VARINRRLLLRVHKLLARCGGPDAFPHCDQVVDVLLGESDPESNARNVRQVSDGSKIVKLQFLGKDSTPTNSPTLYATDENSYVVQGWIVTDPAILGALTINDDETVVEVPARLMTHLAKDGVTGDVAHLVPPIVYLKENGNFIVHGPRVTDRETLSQMNIPDHATCVMVMKPATLALLAGA